MRDDDTGTSEVELILHVKQTSYSVGEPINPQLEILNNGSQKVAFNGFAFDGQTLIYGESSAIHLMSSDGQDLALPYQREPAEITNLPTITVDPNSKEWMYLPIYSHFHLRKPGQYVFWLELESEEGTVYESNHIEFQITPIEISTIVKGIALKLDTQNLIFDTNQKLEVEAIFYNKSNQPISLLLPQDDSFYGWTNPTYQFSIIDNKNRLIPLAQRSGTMALPLYGEDKQLIVLSGGNEKMLLSLPPLARKLAPGSYQVKLTYLVRETQIGKAGTILDQNMNWPAVVYVGLLESNIIRITIK